MKRRQNVAEVDSLDLLMDPICNMFGGIIFIAMLVIMLSTLTSHQNAARALGPPAPVRSAAESSRLREQGQRIDDLRRAIDTLSRIESQTVRPEEKESVRTLEQISQATTQASQMKQSAEEWLSEYHKILSSQPKDLDRRIDAVRAQIDLLKTELDRTANVNTAEARLPVEQRTSKQQIILILKNNRVYVTPLGSGAKSLADAFPHEAEVVELFSSYTVTPSAGRGFAIPDNQPCPQLDRIFGSTSPDIIFFDMFVYPDSVAVFRRFKSALLSKGYRYNAHVLAADSVLSLKQTNEVHTQ